MQNEQTNHSETTDTTNQNGVKNSDRRWAIGQLFKAGGATAILLALQACGVSTTEPSAESTPEPTLPPTQTPTRAPSSPTSSPTSIPQPTQQPTVTQVQSPTPTETPVEQTIETYPQSTPTPAEIIPAQTYEISATDLVEPENLTMYGMSLIRPGARLLSQVLWQYPSAEPEQFQHEARPGYLNYTKLKALILPNFPYILNVDDICLGSLDLWQLTGTRVGWFIQLKNSLSGTTSNLMKVSTPNKAFSSAATGEYRLFPPDSTHITTGESVVNGTTIAVTILFGYERGTTAKRAIELVNLQAAATINDDDLVMRIHILEGYTAKVK